LKALVTGSGGFLGRHVVHALLGHGHAVRAVLRPASGDPPPEWKGRAEIVRADLRAPASEELFDGVDVLVHLAATMSGSAEAAFAGTVVSTEKLCETMLRTGSTRRVVLASSFSVYDWTAPKRALTEETPIEPKPYDRDGYAVMKIWQERVVRRLAAEQGWTLTVLRPGFIYGPAWPEVGGAGISLKKLFLVVSPFSSLPLTHVENCAQAFAVAAEKGLAGTFNIIDDESITAWRYAGKFLSHSGAIRIPVPYWLGLGVAYSAQCVSRILFPPSGGKLPAFLVPQRYRARFRPLEFPNRRAKETLGWSSKPFFDSARALT